MTIKADSPKVLILGGGIAGLSAAIHFSEFSSVTLLTKSTLDEGNTRYAQGGIAAAWSQDDTPEEHQQDTLSAGAGLCSESIVNLCVTEGPDRVRELISWGVEFTKHKPGPFNPPSDLDLSQYSLHREGGHLKRRILHTQDFTGLAIQEALIARVKSIPQITVLENHMAIDLIMEGKINGHSSHSELGRCIGAYVQNTQTQAITPMKADLTLIASGGMGKVYLYTSNPDVATGDGVAMAYRAGARISNLEFMQFHPTCLYHPQAKNFLVTEALRGEGAVLRNHSGEDFLLRFHELGSLAPRYVVAQAIDSEMKRTGEPHVWLDASHMSESEFKEKFPRVYSVCREFGISVPEEKIPVVPAAHYMCGGVQTDEHGRTSVDGLSVIGESACTGLHGANRLASNSLLEAVVFSKRAAEFSKKHLVKHPDLDAKNLPSWEFGRAVDLEEQIDIAATWKEIRTIMWNYVGIVRSDRRLKRAKERLALIRHEVNQDYWKFKINRDLAELRNILTVAELVVECAQRRKESRGLHFNVNYPHTVSKENHNTVI